MQHACTCAPSPEVAAATGVQYPGYWAIWAIWAMGHFTSAMCNTHFWEQVHQHDVIIIIIIIITRLSSPQG